VKECLVSASEYAILMVDAMALVVVVFASIEAFIQAVRLVVLRTPALQGREVWLRFLRLLVAALTFQLAADIIETAISTTWDSLARIAVIAAVRTFLNYFLERDLRELRDLEKV
jgi:uncharacterized membrane protein